MKRLATVLVLLVAGTLGFLATGAGEDPTGSRDYWVELDNAFGLIEGADLKVAGVRAGTIEEMELDQETLKARVRVRVTELGFGDLRTDVFCETKPQSLLGEYFVDCKPGTGEPLDPGSTIPVEQTASTIPADLIADIMRRPYRERFSILISELGAAFAGRGGDLNETIRRLAPSLREVDRVLAVLAEERRVIRDLYEDAEKIMTATAGKKEFLGTYVEELRDTANAYANRAEDIERQFQAFPTFLRELRPTLAALGESAEQQTPALRNLRRATPDLRSLLTTLGTFAEVSRPNFRAFGRAADRGRDAVRQARPNVRLLGRAVKDLPETAQNLGIILEHLDDPAFATEKDARAGRPDGGFTGLEAVLRYIHSQGQAINLYDANNFILKATVFADTSCQNYATPNVQPNLPERCNAWLGPNQPGVNQPDPTATTTTARAAASERALDYLLGE